MAMNLLPRCASVHHQSGACRSPFLTPSEGLATLNPPAWHQCHAKSGIGNGFLGRPVNIIAPMICISRALRLKVRAQRTEYSATFEDLKIQCTGDVVRSYLHTTALSAELLRGPGGRSKFVSQEACKALVEAESVCKGFLPQVLRGSALVSKILDLLVESFRDAASGSNSFRALETPLLTFHNKAPLNMRKALQGRIVSAAGKLLSSPPETYPLGISLTALAAAVRGPGDVSRWKPPEVLQIQSESRWKMPADVRSQVLERDGERCWYCGEKHTDGTNTLTVDHWIPLCRGGTNAMVNLVCACSSCNELKGNYMPDDFAAATGSF
ncbi:Hypothetical protein (Fragment) [Durusdinium trenchii]|uniref:HNH nuclease domain-containing protein n=1 Tax=Durusdinium trenchii TaxID=1381693 RepID=A0ABP0MBU1_9DINO